MTQYRIIHCIVMSETELLELETGVIISKSKMSPNSKLLRQTKIKPAEFWINVWSKMSGPNLQKLNILKNEYGLIF